MNMRAKTNIHIEPGLENPKNPRNPTDPGAADDVTEYPLRPKPTFRGIAIELVPTAPGHAHAHAHGVQCYREAAKLLKSLLRQGGLKCRRIRPLDAEDDQQAAEAAHTLAQARSDGKRGQRGARR